MFGLRSPKDARPPPASQKSTKRIKFKRISVFADVSNTLKRASRRIPLERPEVPTEFCPNCVECILCRSGDPVHDIHLITSLSVSFDGMCPQQELHVAEILGVMGELNHLELLDDQLTPYFYAMLAERAQFQLEYLLCESSLSHTLLHFLSTQRRLLEFVYLAGSLETQTTGRVRGQDILHSVQTLSTVAPLLLHPRLDTTSLRHLEYMGGGQSLREEVRAIEKIYRLGPQLRSLRFAWGAGRTEIFLDVTKFFCIATNTPSIKYIYLSDISRNIFEQFVTMGLRYKTWERLQTLIWVPSPPHENDLDDPESPASPAFPSSFNFAGLSDAIEAVYPPRPRRQSTASSWHSTNSAVSSSSTHSSLTTSTSSRRTRLSLISDVSRVDLGFRIHCIGKDLMATFPSLRRLALWNWSRMGYDLLVKTVSGDLVWMYCVEIDEDEWLSV